MSQTKVKSGLLNFPDQTDFVKLPSGTTAQRPSSPEKGYSRYNTTDNKLEYWNGTIWQQLPGVSPPIITSISYPGDDLAADPDGGQTITINGGDFKAGATVTVDGTTPSVITFVSGAEITFTAPPKTAGDYDIVVTNVDGGNATAVDAMTYNGLPSWTTPAGNLGTFAAGSTIPTITLVATEPDSGTVSYSVTTGALPSGLTLSGADIDGTVPTPAGETTYNFSVTASDDENQESTERAFNIVVYLQVVNTADEVDPFGNSSGIALYKLEPTSNVGSHRYWRYTVGSSTNHHPRVSKIYLVKSDGSKENFVSFTSDNCSDTGDIPTQGTVYDIDLGSDDEAIGSGFYVTFGDGERNINYTLSYSDNNANWNIASSNYVNANACGEWNHAIQIAKDESGNYNGASTSIGYKKGVFGQACLFENNTNFNQPSVDHITMSNITGVTSFSVSLWAKLGTIVEPNGGSFVSLVSNTNSNYQIGLFAGGSTERFFRAGFAGDGTLGAQNTYNFMLDNQWHHIVNVYTGGVDSKVYVDGTLVSTVASSSAQTMLINEISKSGGSKTGFNGSIDQVRIFNTALDPLEVESLYRERTVVCGGQADTLNILGDNSCIATYQLNGNANDLSGNYSGTEVGTISYEVGEFDLAVAFSGTNYITTPTLPDYRSGFAFSCWVLSDTTLNKYIITQKGTGDYANFQFRLVNGKINVTTGNGTSAYYIQYQHPTALTDGWHHLVVTGTASSISIYADGSLLTTQTGTAFVNSSNMQHVLGANYYLGSIFTQFAGAFSLDQFRIFNKALNSTEVTTLYNETACDALACSGTTNTLDILSDGSCIAAYPLNGSPADLSGNYNGVQTDVTYPVGKYDLAASFNGSRIQANNVTGFPSGNAARSVSVWVKQTVANISQGIVMWGTGASNQAFVLYPNGTELNIATYGAPVPTGYNFTLNQWTHIVVTHDGTTTKVYADNVLVNSFNYTYNTATNSFVIGNVAWAEEPFTGEIDQVRIFNKALSAGEVTTLYNETACN